MKKSWKISFLISFIVLIGAIVTGAITYSAYSKVLKDSTRNIAELSAMNVYSKIDNELTKPIYVSLTMAHDSFVKDWLSRENSTNQNEIITYLDGVYDKYEYNSVFLVSSSTNIYYYYDGINKVVSPDDGHDIWYYNFLNSPDAYNLDVDVDEVTGVLTIFINVKIFNDNEEVIAVVGVGVEMDYVLSIMQDFENNYDLKIYLIDEFGLVQSSTDVNEIENKNVFSDINQNISAQIISDKNNLQTFSQDRESEYVISRYINDLDWYILVEKDTNLFEKFFLDYFWLSMIMIIAVLALVSNIIIITINKYQKRIYNLAKTDYLTLLLNRRGFNDEFEKLSLDKKEALVFMADVDGFKDINDKYGHSTGDDVLKYLANLIDSEVSNFGKLSRWGGDEFTGFMFGNREEVVKCLNIIVEKINTDDFFENKKISISIGYTFTDMTENLDLVLNKVDFALYEAKAKGGNNIVYKK